MVVTIYRPPSGSVCQFLETLHEFMTLLDLYTHRQDFIFFGDLNIDMNERSDSQDRVNMLLICQSFGLEQLISSPTRFGRSKNSTLDVILARATHIAGFGRVNIN